ncbi:MAG: nitronate monooxygenase [Alphaproteobacteria bacterium]|nr:MAG: nitronate monooxygenase [Alphaproteobacteria bacterium]
MIDILGTELPIVQAPMAGVSTPELAAAVSNAGGLGSLGIGANTAEQARAAIIQTRALTERQFNVNVFCHEPAKRDKKREADWLEHLTPLFSDFGADAPAELTEIYQSFLTDEAAFRMLLDERPAIVSFHFGLPSASRIAALRAAGVKTLATATNLAEAQAIEAAGIDGIVAQGIEAGGHRGMFDPEAVDEKLSTFVLTRILVAKTRLPVIAAGGIMDGAGIRAALDLGAVAAQLGTAFVLCPESAANAGYRQNLSSERGSVTRLTAVLSGRPARGIVNRFIEHCEAAGSPLPAPYPLAYDAAKKLHAIAAKSGSNEFAAHWAGQAAALSRELPAGQLVGTLARELHAAGR